MFWLKSIGKPVGTDNIQVLRLRLEGQFDECCNWIESNIKCSRILKLNPIILIEYRNEKQLISEVDKLLTVCKPKSSDVDNESFKLFIYEDSIEVFPRPNGFSKTAKFIQSIILDDEFTIDDEPYYYNQSIWHTQIEKYLDGNKVKDNNLIKLFIEKQIGLDLTFRSKSLQITTNISWEVPTFGPIYIKIIDKSKTKEFFDKVYSEKDRF